MKEERDAVIAKYKAEGLSTRTIAEKVGCDPMTVHSVPNPTRSLVDDSTREQPPTKVQTSDGKTYPAKRLDAGARQHRDEAIREKKEAGVTVRRIAEELGVSLGTVTNVPAGTNSDPEEGVSEAASGPRPDPAPPALELLRAAWDRHCRPHFAALAPAERAQFLQEVT